MTTAAATTTTTTSRVLFRSQKPVSTHPRLRESATLLTMLPLKQRRRSLQSQSSSRLPGRCTQCCFTATDTVLGPYKGQISNVKSEIDIVHS